MTNNRKAFYFFKYVIILQMSCSFLFVSCNKKDKTQKAESVTHQDLIKQQLADSNQATLEDSIYLVDSDTIYSESTPPRSRIEEYRKNTPKTKKEQQLINEEEIPTSIEQPQFRKGREVKADEMKAYHWKNMRMMFEQSILDENDYITGSELAKFIMSRSTANKSVKKLTSWFISSRIDRIEKHNKILVIRTKDSKNINERLYIPGIVNIRLKIQDQSQVLLGKSFQATTPPFTKRYLLPMSIEGIEVTNQGNPVILKGHLCGDLLYTNYPKSTEGVPLHLK